MIKKNIKLVIINIVVIFILLIMLETIFYSIRLGLKSSDIGYLFRKNDLITDQISHDCSRFRTHPFLTFIHDHANNCNLKGAKMFGQFVYYGEKDVITNEFIEYKSQNYILTLGGSTTDGTNQSYANGQTWPYLLNKKLISSDLDFSIINGGISGYGSHQELLKLLIIGGNINKNISHIISLNGINDMEGYRGLSKDLEKILPFWTKDQLDNFKYQKLINKDGSKYHPKILPNIRWALDRLILILNSGLPGVNLSSENEISPRWKSSILFKDLKNKTPSEQWLYNVKMMHTISSQLNIKYFVFLQPTMGVSDNQIPKGPSTSDYKIWEDFKAEKRINYLHQVDYLNKIKKHYEELTRYCGQLSFCVDISDIAPPTGNNYSDLRHHNEHGNKLIAEAIFNKLNLISR